MTTIPTLFLDDRARRLRTLDVFPAFVPTPSWELDVADYLYWRGYQPSSIMNVLIHAREAGSVECSDELRFDARDRFAVEKLLPDAPAADWEAHAGAWEMTGVVP